VLVVPCRRRFGRRLVASVSPGSRPLLLRVASSSPPHRLLVAASSFPLCFLVTQPRRHVVAFSSSLPSSYPLCHSLSHRRLSSWPSWSPPRAPSPRYFLAAAPSSRSSSSPRRLTSSPPRRRPLLSPLGRLLVASS
jgi:hypothetical protein